ncbi:hypothetical protein GCM10027400_24600 [Pseudoxanthomonas daejeonensis]
MTATPGASETDGRRVPDAIGSTGWSPFLRKAAATPGWLPARRLPTSVPYGPVTSRTFGYTARLMHLPASPANG